MVRPARPRRAVPAQTTTTEPPADATDTAEAVDAAPGVDGPPPADGLPAAGYVIATARLHTAGGARAHNPGDRVPVGNVDRNGWQDLVRPPAPGE
jgi:hypothetical protein